MEKTKVRNNRLRTLHAKMENAVTDVEPDVGANINTDHAPLIAKIRIKLNNVKEEAPARRKLVFTIPTEEQRNQFDEQVAEAWRTWEEAATTEEQHPTTEDLAKGINDIAESQLPHNAIKRKWVELSLELEELI